MQSCNRAIMQPCTLVGGCSDLDHLRPRRRVHLPRRRLERKHVHMFVCWWDASAVVFPCASAPCAGHTRQRSAARDGTAGRQDGGTAGRQREHGCCASGRTAQRSAGRRDGRTAGRRREHGCCASGRTAGRQDECGCCTSGRRVGLASVPHRTSNGIPGSITAPPLGDAVTASSITACWAGAYLCVHKTTHDTVQPRRQSCHGGGGDGDGHAETVARVP